MSEISNRIVQKLWSLLQRPARRRAVVPGLPRAAHVPAVPQDGRRARARSPARSSRSRRATAGPTSPTRRWRASGWRSTTARRCASSAKQGGMLGLIFRKAQNKIQDPAKLRQLIVELIGKEDWLGDVRRREGRRLRGPAREERPGHQERRGAVLHAARRSSTAIVDCVRPEPGEVDRRPGLRHRRLPARRPRLRRRATTSSTATRSGTCATRRCAASRSWTASRACAP